MISKKLRNFKNDLFDIDVSKTYIKDNKDYIIYSKKDNYIIKYLDFNGASIHHFCIELGGKNISISPFSIKIKEEEEIKSLNKLFEIPQLRILKLLNK